MRRCPTCEFVLLDLVPREVTEALFDCVYDESAWDRASAQIVAAASQIADALETVPVARLGRSHGDGTWSALEYACHLRDVLIYQRERVLRALRGFGHEALPMGRNERAEHDGYAAQNPADVGAQLRQAAGLFVNVLGRLRPEDWDLTVHYLFPEPRPRTIRWLAVHTAHETVHHCFDIASLVTDLVEEDPEPEMQDKETLWLILVTGWTGAGKSTVADSIAAELNATVTSFDWLMSGLRAIPAVWDAVELPVEQQRRIGWNLLGRSAEQQLRRGSSCARPRRPRGDTTRVDRTRRPLRRPVRCCRVHLLRRASAPIPHRRQGSRHPRLVRTGVAKRAAGSRTLRAPPESEARHRCRAPAGGQHRRRLIVARPLAGRSPLRPFVVIISGVPGAGKTTLAWQLSRLLHVPMLSRDDIKTGLHVSAESDDPSDVWQFASRAFEVFYETAENYLRADVSIVIEAAFHAGYSEPELAALAELGNLVHLEVATPHDVSLRRYRARAEAGLRHPAHNDAAFAGQMESGEKDLSVYRIDVPCPGLVVEGTDGWSPDLDTIKRVVLENR